MIKRFEIKIDRKDRKNCGIYGSQNYKKMIKFKKILKKRLSNRLKNVKKKVLENNWKHLKNEIFCKSNEKMKIEKIKKLNKINRSFSFLYEKWKWCKDWTYSR